MNVSLCSEKYIHKRTQTLINDICECNVYRIVIENETVWHDYVYEHKNM